MTQNAVFEPRSPSPHPSAPPPAPEKAADEIRLIDVLLVLAGHRWLFFGVGLFLLIALPAAWFLLPKSYRYLTTIEIGTTTPGQHQLLTEPAEVARTKLETLWIPAYQQERHTKPNGDYVELSVSIPPGTSLLVLESAGRAGEAEVHLEAHEEVAGNLLDEYHRIEELARLRLSNRLQAEKLQLASLQDESELLQTRLKHASEERSLLLQEDEQLQVELEEAALRRDQAISEATDETRAMTLLMIDNEIRKTRAWREQIRNRLFVDLPNERAELAKDLEEHERKMERQAATITEVEEELRNFRSTRMVSRALRSLEPIGFGGQSVVAVALVSVIVALLGAAGAVLVARLRDELRLKLAEGARPE